MKRLGTTLLLLLIVFLVIGLYACKQERHRQWQYDIVQFRDHTLAWHPRFVDENLMILPQNVELRETFEESVDALLDAVSGLTNFEIKVEIQRTVALLQDNHFYFGIDGEGFLSSLLAERYPLMFGWFVDGWYLYQSCVDFSDALNYRLIAINDTPLEEIFEAFKSFWSLENIYDARDGFARILNAPLVLKALKVVDESQVIYTFIDSVGETFEIILTTSLPENEILYNEQLQDRRFAGALPLFHQNSPLGQEQYVWYVFVPEDGILYLRFTVYRPLPPESLNVLEQSMQNIFTDYEVEAMIIDARGNLGGDHSPFKLLFRQLAADAPPNMLFYFADEGSRSASLLAADYLERLGAIIVGQPLGQATEFYGFYGGSSPPWQTHLTYSQLRISVPNEAWNVRASEDNVFRPHVLIDYTIDDWIHNRDPLYDYVLDLLN